MKKFLSFFCALAIVLSASAAPQLTKQARAQKADRAYAERLHAQKQDAPKAHKAVKKVSFGKKGAAFAPKAFDQKASQKLAINGKQLKPAAQIARAPKAKKETFTLDTWSKVSWADYTEYYGWWQIQAESDDYYVTLSNGAAVDAAPGTYPLADLDDDYSFIYLLEDGDAVDIVTFTDGSVTISIDEEGAVTAEGTFTGDDDNTYNITIVYVEEPIEAGEWDIEIASVSENYYSSWGDVYLVMYNEDNTCRIVLDVFVEDESGLELGKTYTLDDMDHDYSNIYLNEVRGTLVAANVTKTIDEDNLEHLVGSATDEYGRTLNFTYVEEPFIPTGEEVAHSFAECVSLSYSSYYGEWIVFVNDGEFAFQLDIKSENAESPAGEYDSENGDFELNYTYVDVYDEFGDSEVFYAHDAKATISERNDSIFVEAEIMAQNGVLYQFSAFFAAPDKKGEATIEATNLNIDDSWFDWFGVVWADASNEDYLVELELTSNEGEFTEVGYDFAGTITNIAAEKASKIYSGEIKVEKTEEGYQLTGKVLCFDHIEYTLNLTYVVPDATREETITITDAELVIYEDYGDWQVTGFNADYSRYVSIDILSDVVAGEYTIDDVYAYYTYVYNVEEGEEGLEVAESFDPLKLNITVTFNETDSTATITGTYRGQGYYDDTDVPEFTLDITAKVSIYVAPDYDAAEDFVVDFDDYVVNDTYLESDGVLFISSVTENNEYIRLELWLPDDAEGLVAGEYLVSDYEYVSSTVTSGELYNGYIYGSFASTVDEDGYINVPLWLITEGTVTVAEDLTITVDAVNPKGAAIKCHLGASSEAIDNVDAKAAATKRVVNGQLLIEKNGVKYNAQGAVVK
mgnify:CR=1 FL=1